MRILSVVGARPQFIKAFAVSKQLREEHNERLVHTGQHYDYDLSEVFFEELGIPEPEYHLGVGSGSHGVQTAEVIRSFESVLMDEEPDAVIVYGDTNSTLGAALVTAKSDASLVHVEAGLRSRNRSMPEEINRVLTDHAADLLLAPTVDAAVNLADEGLIDRTHLTGDVMYDTLLWARGRAGKGSELLDKHGLRSEEYILFTLHRASNTDDRRTLKTIFETMLDRPERIVFPAHPRTVAALRDIGMYDRIKRELTMLDPVSYLEFIHLQDNAWRIVTDSGGVQKEAFLLDTPCITLREETEWPETVEAGWNVLVGSDRSRINDALDQSFDLTKTKPQPYGDGTAARTVVKALADTLDERAPRTTAP